MRTMGKMLLWLFVIPGNTLVFGAIGGASGFATFILMGKYGLGGIVPSVAGAWYFYIWYFLLPFVGTVVGFSIGLIVSIRGVNRWSDQTLTVLGTSHAALLASVIILVKLWPRH